MLSGFRRALSERHPPPILRWMRGGCRRGATSLLFAATATSLPGLVAMGTEMGAWHLAKRQGQNVADAAAMAGAPPVANSEVVAAAGTTATLNRRTGGGGGIAVATSHPRAAGPHAGKPGYAKAIVARTAGDTMTVSGASIGCALGLRGRRHEGRALPAGHDGGVTRC